MSLFNLRERKEIQSEYNNLVEKYQNLYKSMNTLAEDNATKMNTLYEDRKKALKEMKRLKFYIESRPESHESLKLGIARAISFSDIIDKAWQEELKGANHNWKQSQDSIIGAAAGTTAGIAAGAAVGTMGPAAAMAFATTFGSASTGAAISTLGGAAATNAALAWLGGGAIAAGGSGVAGGTLILSLLGPIGLGIGGIAAITGIFVSRKKNKKIIDELTSKIDPLRNAVSQITVAVKSLTDAQSRLNSLIEKTSALTKKIHISESQQRTGISDDLLFNVVESAKLLGKISQEIIYI